MAQVSKASTEEEKGETNEGKNEVHDEKLPLLDGRSRSLSDYGSVSVPSTEELVCRQFGHDAKVEILYTPKPVSDLSPQRLGVVLCLLTVELFERLAYFGVVANLVLYSTSKLNFSSSDATTISLVFSGTTYLLPILGGYISDAHLGMYNTIFASCLIYLLGLFMLPCSAINYNDLFGDDQYTLDLTWRRALFLVGLGLVSIGTGGIEANIGPFGARQVQDAGPKAVQTFFNWYYWFLNAGALTAYIGVAAVQQNVSFALGFFLLFVSMVLAIFFLLLARSNYRHQKVSGSVMADSFAVCLQSCRKSPEKVEGAEDLFDKARTANGGSFSDTTVDGAVSIVKVLPFFIFTTMHSVIYAQEQSTFFVQGERMDLNIGGSEMPVAVLNAFNTGALILVIPLLDRFVYPWFQRINRPLTPLKRIGIGLFLSTLSMVAAALVEVERKENFGFYQEVGGEEFFASNTTVFLQIPQFALFGVSEAFTTISGLEFVYTQSPPGMQGAMTGIYMANLGLGSYLATAILKIVEEATRDDPWFPDEINDGHAEYLFYMLGGLMGAFFLIFVVASKFYKYKTFDDSLYIDRQEKSKEKTCDSAQV